ncbi:MAG: DUF1670 domain-containing protein [Candidatus Methanoperedens sp.]|nr:DUF1670 domain-containing protein [Candidatus Methanoperedens sp.]
MIQQRGDQENIAMTKQKTVLLTLVSRRCPAASKGHKPKELLPDVIARILLEAEEQGGVLAMNAMMHCFTAAVSKARETWETKHGKILPTRGSLHDMGKTFTHKKQIVDLHIQGYFTSEITRMTNHDLLT